MWRFYNYRLFLQVVAAVEYHPPVLSRSINVELSIVYVSSYNPLLVVASLFVAILASYTALDMAGAITTAQGRSARLWLVRGAAAKGSGIWSMPFTGMLVFCLPLPLGDGPRITFLSPL